MNQLINARIKTARVIAAEKSGKENGPANSAREI